MNLNIPDNGKPRVVIIGGGFAGLSLIKHIDRNAFQFILIDKNNYHTFQPLLYQVATGGLEAGSIAYPLRRYISHYKNVIFRMAEVLQVNADNNEIITSIGNIHYDYLVIATGSKNNFFGNKLLEQNALLLKNIPQSLDLRNILLKNFELASQTDEDNEREALMNFVIAGGGPTGVEMAGALTELKKHVLSNDYPELDLVKMNVTIVEGTDRLLNAMSNVSSDKAREFLEKMEVKIILNVRITSYDGSLVVLSDGSTIKTHSFLWAAGVKGDIPSGIPAESVTPSNRIRTNVYNQFEMYKNIFVAGDAAACISPGNPLGHPMIASVAIQQGRNIAYNISLLHKGKNLIPFAYFNKGSMATIGRNKAVVELPSFKFQGIFAWFVWTFVHLLAIVGFRNKIMVFLDWMWSYFNYDKSLRFIISPSKKE